MPLTLTVILNSCKDCRHIGHSGAFTTGGAKPICDHPDVSECVKIIKNLEDQDANTVLEADVGKQCWYWKNRVIPYTRVENDSKRGYSREAKKTIPVWCPLRNGSAY